MSPQQTGAVESMAALLRRGRFDAFLAAAVQLDPADLADVLAALNDEERVSVVRRLPPELASQALVEMPEDTHAEDTLAALHPSEAAEIVQQLEDDDAADILGELAPEHQARILAEVKDRADVEQLLRYHEESAGGLMTGHLVMVLHGETVGQALESVRRQAEDVEDFSQVFVVDEGRRLVGVLSFKTLVVSGPDRLVSEVMEEADVTVGPQEDQEDVARLMARYNVPSIPVVDPDGRLLGRVTFDDVIDVVEAETTEDLLRFGGVSADEELGASWRDAVRSRLPWLFANLLTAFLAASVVLLLQDTIARFLVLAAWMPIVAGLGGNTGTQALAVTVRRIALGQISPERYLGVIAKEVAVGVTNGLTIGTVAGLIAVAAGHGPMLGVVVFLAMTGNLLVAGFLGAFVPLLLKRVGADPAVSSSMFVTPFTDLCGFALLLGLAGSLLL